MTAKYSRQEFIAAFWAKVRKTATCWLWTGARNSTPGENYGFVSVNRKTRRAHVVSYILKHGQLPAGALVLHKCDNPPCVRPGHLFLGTHKDNAIDRNAKGRITYKKGRDHWTHRTPRKVARGSSHGRNTKPERTARGDRHGMAILTQEKVATIRLLYLTGRFSYAQLASRSGVSKSTVGMMLEGRNWGYSSAALKAAIERVRSERISGKRLVEKETSPCRNR